MPAEARDMLRGSRTRQGQGGRGGAAGGWRRGVVRGELGDAAAAKPCGWNWRGRGRTLARQWVKQGADVVAAAGKLLLRQPDPSDGLQGAAGAVAKRAAWSQPLPLDQIKAIGRATEAGR